MASNHTWVKQMTPKEKPFYRELGQRIAQCRKAQDITQVQLSAKLGIAQQTIAHYEAGNLRIPVALLKPVARILGMSVDELLDEPAAKKKRGPHSQFQLKIEQVQQLPRTKQKFVLEMLDTVIKQAS